MKAVSFSRKSTKTKNFKKSRFDLKKGKPKLQNWNSPEIDHKFIKLFILNGRLPEPFLSRTFFKISA